MSKLIVKDGYYRKWIEDLCARFDKSRIRAFVKVNDELLRFYWSVGEDIVKKEAEARWGDNCCKESGSFRSPAGDRRIFDY